MSNQSISKFNRFHDQILQYFTSVQQITQHMGKRIQERITNQTMTEETQKQEEANDTKIKFKYFFGYQIQQKCHTLFQLKNLQNNQIYCGQIGPGICYVPSHIQHLVDKGQYEIVSQDQNSIKIKLGIFTAVQLIPKKQSLKKKIKSMQEEQSQLFRFIESSKVLADKNQMILSLLKSQLQFFQSGLVRKYGDVKKSITEEHMTNNQISEEQQKTNQIPEQNINQIPEVQKTKRIPEEHQTNPMNSSDPIIQNTNQQNQQQIRTQIIPAVQIEQNPQIEKNPDTCQNDKQTPQQ